MKISLVPTTSRDPDRIHKYLNQGVGTVTIPPQVKPRLFGFLCGSRRRIAHELSNNYRLLFGLGAGMYSPKIFARLRRPVDQGVFNYYRVLYVK